MTTSTTEHTFPVFQSLRISVKIPMGGTVLRVRTLGPRLDNTPETAVGAIEGLQQAKVA